MFGWGEKHKLPKFPPNVIPTFRGLCEQLSYDKVMKLRGYVDKSVLELQKKAEDKGHLDTDKAHDIAQACYYLIDNYETASVKVQPLIVGAVRYFVSEDPYSESHFATGLDDDAKIVNHVLEKLGALDRCIEL